MPGKWWRRFWDLPCVSVELAAILLTRTGTYECVVCHASGSASWLCEVCIILHTIQRFSRAGPRGRGREWATLGVHPLSWLLSNNRLEEVCGTLTKGTSSNRLLLSNNRLEEVCGTLTKGTSSNRLLLSNQDKGCTPSVAHSLPLPSWPRSVKPLYWFPHCMYINVAYVRFHLKFKLS